MLLCFHFGEPSERARYRRLQFEPMVGRIPMSTNGTVDTVSVENRRIGEAIQHRSTCASFMVHKKEEHLAYIVLHQQPTSDINDRTARVSHASQSTENNALGGR